MDHSPDIPRAHQKLVSGLQEDRCIQLSQTASTQSSSETGTTCEAQNRLAHSFRLIHGLQRPAAMVCRWSSVNLDAHRVCIQSVSWSSIHLFTQASSHILIHPADIY